MFKYLYIFLILFIPSTSYAYLDPGAGSFFTQFILMLFAIITTAYFYFKNMIIKIFFKIKNLIKKINK